MNLLRIIFDQPPYTYLPWWAWLLFAVGLWAAGFFIAFKRDLMENTVDIDIGRELDKEYDRIRGSIIATPGVICAIIGIARYLDQ
jgi:uncharacterized membrane protein YidH (DUF202 family)